MAWCRSPVWIKSGSAFTSCQLGPRPFCTTLLTLKDTTRQDISIQETCWHTYQTSQRQVSFPEGLKGVIETLKARLDSNITKGWEDMNTLWLKAKAAWGEEKKKAEMHSAGGWGVAVGLAPFPPKKRRVKRWTLYKWNSISRHIILPCSLSWLSFSLRPETIIN